MGYPTTSHRSIWYNKPSVNLQNNVTMSVGGAVLRFGGLFLRILQFCCAGIALGIYSYFLSVLADRDLPIATWKKAVEGIVGAAVLYTIIAILLVLFLGGKTFFG